MRCEEPVKIIDILRLWEMGLSQRDIAHSVKCPIALLAVWRGRAKNGRPDISGLPYEKLLQEGIFGELLLI